MRKLHLFAVVSMSLVAIACSNDRSTLPLPSGASAAPISGSVRQQEVMTVQAKAVERQHVQADAQRQLRNEIEQNKLKNLLDTLTSNFLTWQVDSHIIVASGLVECLIKQGDFVLSTRQNPGMPMRRIIYASTDYGIYPQTTIYLKIDEKRFTGVEAIEATASIIEYLKNGSKADIAWSAWPYKGQRTGEVYLDGFSDALAKCESFLQENKQR